MRAASVPEAFREGALPDEPVEERLETVREITGELRSERERIVGRTVEETGIPRTDLREEFEGALEALGALGELHDRYREKVELSGSAYGTDFRIAPKGTVAVFTPWNTPILSQLFLPCLSYVAGNRTLLKPSSRSNAASGVLMSVVERIDPTVPIYRTEESGRAVADALDEQQVDYVYFMGARDVGEQIQTSFAGEFFGEYEANNVAIVTEHRPEYVDVLVDSVVEKNGVDCDNLRGAFVAEDAAPALVEDLRAAADELTVGDPDDESTDVSRTIAPEGLEIVTNPDPDELYEPTMKPRLWIRTFEGRDEARTRVEEFFEKSPYGLSTLLLTEDDPERWTSFLHERTPTTRVCVNKSPLSFVPQAPWGGRGRTANGGALPWFEKFTDRVVVEGER